MVRSFHTRPKPEEPENKGSGRKLNPVASIRRHFRKAILAGVVIVAAGVPFAWVKGTPKYKSEGVLFVSPRFLRNLDGDQEHELQSNSQYREFVQQQVRTVNRYDIVAAATPEAAQWRLPKESDRRLTDRLRGALQVAPVPDTYQITVALEGDKAEGLSELVNSVMQSYVRTAHRELLYDSATRLKNLEAEKQRLEEVIDGLIDERTQIANELGTTVFSTAIVNSFDRQLGATAEAVMEARRNRFIAEAAVPGERAPRVIREGLQATAQQGALNDNSLNSFKSALTTRKAELTTSIRGLSPQHAARIAAEKEIQAIDREVEALTSALRERLATDLSTINHSRLEQAATVEKNLVNETKKIREQTEAYSRSYQHSLELGEEIERNRKRLHATEDRISYIQLETRAPGFVRVFAPAMTPEFPIQGGRKKLLLMVLLAALAVALALPLGFDYLDPRLLAPQELEMHLGLPVTGWLPKAGATDPNALLRTAVSIRRHIDELRQGVLVVTALGHGGGSSTVSLGLGAALNRLGVRTLVVEANPLTPDPRYFGADPAEGLLPWLANEDAVLPVQAASNGLPDRVATGAGTLEDLLPVERVATRLGTEANEWDLVLIDAAPVPVSLASEELVRVFGASLLVVDAQSDNKRAVTHFLTLLERLAPHAFGAVLNRVDPEHHHDSPSLLAA